MAAAEVMNSTDMAKMPDVPYVSGVAPKVAAEMAGMAPPVAAEMSGAAPVSASGIGYPGPCHVGETESRRSQGPHDRPGPLPSLHGF